MKRICFFTVLIISALAITGCEDLINGMDSHARLSVEDTADVFTEFVLMNFNSDNGALTIAPETIDTVSGMSIEADSSSTCLTMTGDSFVPYTGTTWDASITLTLDNCSASDDGTVFDGTIHARLSGLQGSVSSFDFTGTLQIEGDIEGTLSLDLHYEVDSSCLLYLDCWEGSINGYSIQEIRNALLK
ncbi:MAG: hypothetical protein CVV44_02520 [Spirochaetae bacterium HGW-Spirochaetae-1]|jgi:hypothetical protein|nr:MAG: hypothetical protein CVV44_02520 [Spirochaetae bacterium HGW-Spirochaetae-1]